MAKRSRTQHDRVTARPDAARPENAAGGIEWKPGTRWLWLWTYVKMPFVIIVLLLYAGQGGTLMWYYLSCAAFMGLVLFGLARRASWGWAFNLLVMLIEGLLFAFVRPSGVSSAMDSWPQSRVLGLYAWVLPNLVYFIKRQKLFFRQPPGTEEHSPGKMARNNADTEKGIELIPEPFRQEAEEAFRRIQETIPLLLLLFERLRGRGGGLARANELLAKHPDDTGIRYSRAYDAYSLHFYDIAVEDFLFLERAGVSFSGKGARSQASKGNWYAERGQPERAIYEYGKALQIDPSNLWFNLYRGIALARTGNFEAALKDFETSEPFTNDWPSLRIYRGYTYYLMGQFSRAAEELQEAFAYSGRSRLAHCYIAACHYRLGNIEEALEHLNKARDQSLSWFTRDVADKYPSEREQILRIIPPALAYAIDRVAEMPGDHEAWFELAMLRHLMLWTDALEAGGRAKSAAVRDCYRIATAIDNEFSPGWAFMIAASDDHDFEDAAIWLERATRAEKPAFEAFEFMADLCFVRGQYRDAVQLYDRALTSGWSTALAFFRRSVCNLELGDVEGAFLDLLAFVDYASPERATYVLVPSRMWEVLDRLRHEAVSLDYDRDAVFASAVSDRRWIRERNELVKQVGALRRAVDAYEELALGIRLYVETTPAVLRWLQFGSGQRLLTRLLKAVQEAVAILDRAKKGEDVLSEVRSFRWPSLSAGMVRRALAMAAAYRALYGDRSPVFPLSDRQKSALRRLALRYF